MARGRTGKRGSAAGKRRTQKKRMTKRVLTGGTNTTVSKQKKGWSFLKSSNKHTVGPVPAKPDNAKPDNAKLKYNPDMDPEFMVTPKNIANTADMRYQGVGGAPIDPKAAFEAIAGTERRGTMYTQLNPVTTAKTANQTPTSSTNPQQQEFNKTKKNWHGIKQVAGMLKAAKGLFTKKSRTGNTKLVIDTQSAPEEKKENVTHDSSSLGEYSNLNELVKSKLGEYHYANPETLSIPESTQKLKNSPSAFKNVTFVTKPGSNTTYYPGPVRVDNLYAAPVRVLRAKAAAEKANAEDASPIIEPDEVRDFVEEALAAQAAQAQKEKNQGPPVASPQKRPGPPVAQKPNRKGPQVAQKPNRKGPPVAPKPPTRTTPPKQVVQGVGPVIATEESSM